MSTTVKRITLALTKEQERQLKWLSDYLGEHKSQVIHRAIAMLFVKYAPFTIEVKPNNPPQP